MSISFNIMLSSSVDGNCPKLRKTVPSSSAVMDPSPSLSNNLNASCSSENNSCCCETHQTIHSSLLM